MDVVDRSQKKTFGSFKMSLRLEKAGSHTKLATLGLACLNKPGQWGLSLILTIHSLSLIQIPCIVCRPLVTIFCVSRS
jgi:hypothetical protein